MLIFFDAFAIRNQFNRSPVSLSTTKKLVNKIKLVGKYIHE